MSPSHSPRFDTGQINQKSHIRSNQIMTLNSSDIHSPVQPSQDYNPKQLQVLDSSVRTVSIQIAYPFSDPRRREDETPPAYSGASTSISLNRRYNKLTTAVQMPSMAKINSQSTKSSSKIGKKAGLYRSSNATPGSVIHSRAALNSHRSIS